MQEKERIGYMRKALQLAVKGAGWVAPNPAVGAVIVKGGQIIGRGYHQRFGQPHAEINALAAGYKSTLNLSPADALKKAVDKLAPPYKKELEAKKPASKQTTERKQEKAKRVAKEPVRSKGSSVKNISVATPIASIVPTIARLPKFDNKSFLVYKTLTELIMNNIAFRLIANAGALAMNVGLWFNNFYAALSTLLLCGFVLSCIDYVKYLKSNN